MAFTKQPGFRQGAAAANLLDDSPAPTPTSGSGREDTILAKRKLKMSAKPMPSPKARSATGQKSFSSGRAPQSKSASMVKKLVR